MSRTSSQPPVDRLERPLSSLRISVTDRCNIRCNYCMPDDEYVWLPRQSILTYEEILRLVKIFAGMGVRKVRITGGEPLLRHDLDSLVRLLSDSGVLDDIALTTNGVLLSKYAATLKAAGLRRLTMSLDTLRPDRFRQFTRTDRHRDVLDGVRAAQRCGFRGTKINAVVIRGANDDEIIDLLEFGRTNGIEVRLIEYMDVGGATRWSSEQVVPRREMLDRIAAHYGGHEKVERKSDEAGRPTADRFKLPDGTTFGIVASTTEPFCGSCDRSRLTADGTWFLCLYARKGIDLRGPLRTGASDAELTRLITEAWQQRDDRGAERRLAEPEREALYPVASLRADPLKEMHTRGG